MQFLMENPQVFSSLPDKFELVILPDDDPEIRQYNLDLIDKYGSEGRPIRLEVCRRSLAPDPFRRYLERVNHLDCGGRETNASLCDRLSPMI